MCTIKEEGGKRNWGKIICYSCFMDIRSAGCLYDHKAKLLISLHDTVFVLWDTLSSKTNFLRVVISCLNSRNPMEMMQLSLQMKFSGELSK